MSINLAYKIDRNTFPADNIDVKRLLQILLPSIYLLTFFIPGYTYFVIAKRGTIDVLTSSPFSGQMLVIFRLLGLYAFTFAWSQIMLGVFRIPLSRLFGTNMLKFHITFGIFTFLFATLHPLFFYVGMLLSGTSILSALSVYLGEGIALLYGYLGPVAWTIMLVTTSTAFLRRHPLLQKNWRYIHFGNYFVFFFAFLHSFTVGTETQLQPLHYLYYLFGITYLLALGYKWGYQRWYLRRKRLDQAAISAS